MEKKPFFRPHTQHSLLILLSPLQTQTRSCKKKLMHIYARLSKCNIKTHFHALEKSTISNMCWLIVVIHSRFKYAQKNCRNFSCVGKTHVPIWINFNNMQIICRTVVYIQQMMYF